MMDLYSRVKVLGKGSFGAAWLVQRNADKVLFVAKEIRIADLKPEDMRSALNEVAILRTLDHPNVVHYVDHFECKGTMFLIMEYASGGDLHAKIKARRGVPFTEREVLQYFAQVCLAIAHLHEHRILHRDLKTHNIFLTQEGVIKLGDFGISTVLRSTFELRKTVCGTPYYFSPELCLNRPYNNKSDVWALGCTLYELLTLKYAFEGTSFQTLAQKILKGSYPPIDACYSPQLCRLVSHMLHTDPHRRPNVSQIIALPFIQEALTHLQRGVQRAAANGAAICAADSPLLPAPQLSAIHAKPTPSQLTTSSVHAAIAHNNNPINHKVNSSHDAANRNKISDQDSEPAVPQKKPLHAPPNNEGRAVAMRCSTEQACREFLSLAPYVNLTLEEFRQLDYNSQQTVLRGIQAGQARRESRKSHMDQKLEAARRYQAPCRCHSDEKDAPTATPAAVAPHALPQRDNRWVDKVDVGKVAPTAVRELYRQNRQQMQANRQRCTGHAIDNPFVPPVHVDDTGKHAITTSPSPDPASAAAAAAACEDNKCTHHACHNHNGAGGAESAKEQDTSSGYVAKHMSQQELEEARLRAYRQMQQEAKENKRRLMSQCAAQGKGLTAQHAEPPLTLCLPEPTRSVEETGAAALVQQTQKPSSPEFSASFTSSSSSKDVLTAVDPIEIATTPPTTTDGECYTEKAKAKRKVNRAHDMRKAGEAKGNLEMTGHASAEQDTGECKPTTKKDDKRKAEYDALDSIVTQALHSLVKDDRDDFQDHDFSSSDFREDAGDDANPTRFVLDGKTLHLPNVNVRDPLMHRIETLRVFLEENMGEEAMLSCYKAMHSISVTDDAALQNVTKSLPKSVLRFVPLLAQLIVCEESFNRQGRLQ